MKFFLNFKKKRIIWAKMSIVSILRNRGLNSEVVLHIQLVSNMEKLRLKDTEGMHTPGSAALKS